MKKYFMKGTDDELQYGDVIELDLVGTEDGVTKHTHLECKFCPELIDELLEEEIIEVKETKEKKDKKATEWTFKKTCTKDDLIDFGDSKKEKSLNEKVEELEDRIIELEDIIADLLAELEEDERKNP